MISINLFCLGNRCEGRRWKAHADGGDDQADAHQAGVVRDQVHKEVLSSNNTHLLCCRFPRIAVNHEKIIRDKLDERAANARLNNATKAAAANSQQQVGLKQY